MKVTNPKTGNQITVGGKVYNELLKTKYRSQLLRQSPRKSSPKKSSPRKSSPRKSKTPLGCSNQGKYKNVPKNLFCGPEGGACPGTYPVNTRGRAIAALSYARHAPNPEGIRACARRIAKAKGWLKDDKIRRY